MIINTDLSPNKVIDNLKIVFQKAAVNTRHELRFFSVATYDRENQTPQSRMVVLRKFLPNWTMRFYTDFRSGKVTQIQKHPFVSFLFWNPKERYQVRVRATATIHYQNKISEKEWVHVDKEARKAYKNALAPGTPISGPDEGQNLKNDNHYFSVVDAEPILINILQLNRRDHLTMKFVRDSNEEKWKGTWIAP